MKLNLPDQLRATYASENRLVADRLGKEVFVGLSRDESERLARYWQQTGRTWRDDRRDKQTLEERHSRGQIWWLRALNAPAEGGPAIMTADAAFEAGRAAWDMRRALSDLPGHLADFDRMIVAVPDEHRLAAINGWLNAFDDESDRIRAASRE